ncbi:hypothetical protein [Haloglomus salinum]|jgi:hypothetical protein|uniref:hypothetical protein n=1 Tax=Haloglomus salinum TaxID=2962673 RepID=UPI0020C99126|nr:hypothetical protein [Haloglomus salinum]
MSSGLDSPSREEIYDKHNMPRAGRWFVAYLLPILEMVIEVDDGIETKTEDEALAEIALWKAFDNEPKTRPFVLLTSILLFYDYLYHLPFGAYGLFIVGLATLIGLTASIRGRRMLAADYAQVTDEDGIPASLRFRAITVASSTVSLVFVAIGISVQMMATSGLVDSELLHQNKMTGSQLPPIATIAVILLGLYVYGLFRR